MKEKIRGIVVSSAYRIENHAETMDADSALAAVHSDKGYHTAIWNDDFSVTLIRSDLICPFCNVVHPIKRHDEIRQWQMDTMKIWENPQLSLFSRGKVQKKLTLFPIELHRFSCPQCGKQSDDENKTTTIRMKEQKNKIIVRCEITDLCSIYDLPYLPKNRFSVEFPLYEQIEFNFGNGHTCIRIVTEQDCVLHTVETAISYLSEFSFAKAKSVRRLIFEQTGLLFYLLECEKLSRVVDDINIFRKILESRYIFSILILLHQHPLSLDFFAEYCKVKGAKGLLRMIHFGWYDFDYYVLRYCTMNQCSKLLEQKKWRRLRYFKNIDRDISVSCSLPMAEKLPKTVGCVIDGFAFRPLYNTAECFQVGKERRRWNYLKYWQSGEAVMVTVSLANHVVAVMKMRNNIVHVYTDAEDYIEGLSEAIAKWVKRNNIKYFVE